MNLKLLSTQRSRLSGKSRQSGVALVLVLAFVTILTVMLVAFVSKARYDVSASGSFSGGVSADALVQDAVNTLIGGLQEEIEEGSTVITKGEPGKEISIYEPTAPENILPRVDDDARSDDALKPSNLLRSGTSLTIGGENFASEVGTDEPSLNGRTIPLARWNSPQLLTADENAKAPVPRWIYVTRNGPAKPSGSKADHESDDFVIGRYAYRIYNLSGLLDINVAGHPAALSSADRVGRKGSLAWADLKQEFGQGAQDLLEWRGPESEDDYSTYVDAFGQKYGNLLSPSTETEYQYVKDDGTLDKAQFEKANRFFGRGDLLAYVKAHEGDFPEKEKFLTNVTTFSREVNGPSWKLDPANYPSETPVQNSPLGMNPGANKPDNLEQDPDILNIRVTEEFTRRDGTIAKVGEPLMKTRFPLSKIALFKAYKEDPGNEEILTQIENYFGLAPATPGNPDTKWSYIRGRIAEINGFNDPNWAPNRERLKTFQEIANGRDHDSTLDNPRDKIDSPPLKFSPISDAKAREPNFFEILQAGIRGDSLGQSTKSLHIRGSNQMDRNIARNIFQIGANIIDQYDADSDPTVISRRSLESLRGGNSNILPNTDICGIENLPYIQIIGDTQVHDEEGFKAFFQFQLWNPHRNIPANASDLRIVASGDNTQLQIYDVSNNPQAGGKPDVGSPQKSFSADSDWIKFKSSVGFTTPHLLAEKDVELSPTTKMGPYGIVGFMLGDILESELPPNPYKHPKPKKKGDINPDPDYKLETFLDGGMIVQLQKLSESEPPSWIPVQTIGPFFKGKGSNYNHVDPFYETLLDVHDPHPGHNPGSTEDFKNHPGTWLRMHYILSDPRVVRFQLFWKRLTGNEASLVVNHNLPEDSTYTCIKSDDKPQKKIWEPEYMCSQNGSPKQGFIKEDAVLPADLYKNIEEEFGVPTTHLYYSDRRTDRKVYRVGDTVTESESDPKSPYDQSDMTGRPIMLNRPFRTVAEMGYANRNLPWKTLNFTQDVANSTLGNDGVATADSALLDLFSLNETSVRGGIININTASEEVLEILLSGADLKPLGAGSGAEDANLGLSAAEIATLAGQIRNHLNDSRPLRTVADIGVMIQKCPATKGWPKGKREAVVAALADVHNSRTWNVLVDVIAQTGRFPKNAEGVKDFQVTGEKHLWVQVAVDRYTGEVIDQVTEQPIVE